MDVITAMMQPWSSNGFQRSSFTIGIENKAVRNMTQLETIRTSKVCLSVPAVRCVPPIEFKIRQGVEILISRLVSGVALESGRILNLFAA